MQQHSLYWLFDINVTLREAHRTLFEYFFPFFSERKTSCRWQMLMSNHARKNGGGREKNPHFLGPKLVLPHINMAWKCCQTYFCPEAIPEKGAFQSKRGRGGMVCLLAPKRGSPNAHGHFAMIPMLVIHQLRTNSSHSSFISFVK